MKKIKFDNLKENVFYEKLKSGLDVYLIPKREFNRILMNLSIRIGGDTSKVVKEDNIIDIPKGTAHFLEHILFHKEYGSVHSRCSNGAIINGYTGNKSTNFISTFSNNIEENLDILFDLVCKFYISKDSIETEREIILKELELNRDNLKDFIVGKTVEELLGDAILNIEGSEKDIKRINEVDLKNVYDNFYVGKNTAFIAIGNFDENELIELLKNQDRKINTSFSYEKYISIEKLNRERSYSTSCEKNICSLGIKFDHINFNDTREYVKLEYIFYIILEALKFKDLKYKDMKVNMNISKEYKYIIIHKEIDKCRSMLNDFIYDVENCDIDEEYLKILKGTIISKEIMSLDDLEKYIFKFVKHLEDNQIYLEFEEIISDISISDINKLKTTLIDRNNYITLFF